MKSYTPRTRIVPGEKRPGHLVALYEYMEAHMKEHQRYPTNREVLSAGFASSTSIVRYYYDVMARFGMLERDRNVARGIRLIPREDWDSKATAEPRQAIIRDVSEKEGCHEEIPSLAG